MDGGVQAAASVLGFHISLHQINLLLAFVAGVLVQSGLPYAANVWDPAYLFGARQLSSLQELRLIFTSDMLDTRGLGQLSHGVLSLAVAVSAKKGL